MRKLTVTMLTVTAIGLAACSGGSSSTGGGGGSGGGGSASPAGSSGASPAGTSGAVGAPNGSTGGSSSGGSLASSALVGLTKLTQAQLCGVLSAGGASQILGASTSAPAYSNELGLGIVCEWKHGTGSDELYVGISTILDRTGAEAIDQLLKTTTSTIDGHSAIVADKQGVNDYAQIDVELGGDHDPVVEYRAPSIAIATALATAVTPKLLALGGSS